MLYLWLKLFHIISSTLLFGTGLGSAFYMYQANRTRDLSAMYFAARNVVIADWLFTMPAVIIQPLTGFWLLSVMDYHLRAKWLVISLGLYVIAGACWLPVVYIQIKMRDMLRQAMLNKTALPKDYYHYFWAWFALGWPAFIAVIVIFALMLLKPL